MSHKYCSNEQSQSALQAHKVSDKLKQDKLTSLSEADQKLLRDSWHNQPLVKPYIEMLITLIEDNNLSSFNVSFLKNWIDKMAKGRHYRADEQVRSLAIDYRKVG